MASENTNSSRRVPFAIIGLGGIAQSQHLPNLLRVPQIDLQVACDMQPDRLRQIADKYSIPRRASDAREVFADPTIEGVIVATRDDFQAPLTIAALEAGKHVYVEKPLATTPEQCDKVVQAQRRSGKHVAVGFNRRFAPAYCQAREVVAGNGGAHNIHYRIADSYCKTWGVGCPPGRRAARRAAGWWSDADRPAARRSRRRPPDGPPPPPGPARQARRRDTEPAASQFVRRTWWSPQKKVRKSLTR